MSVIGIFLALACGLGWATADVLRKKLVIAGEPLKLAIELSATQCAIAVGIFALMQPFEVEGWSEWSVSLGYWAYALPGFACTAVGHLLFIKALRTSDLSLTIPFLSFSPIFVMLLGAFVLTESPSGLAAAGIVIVALGAYLLDGRAQRQGRSLSSAEVAAYRRGRTLMLITAATWSAAAVLDKGALRHSSPIAHLVILLAATSILLLVYRMLRPTLTRKHAPQTAPGAPSSTSEPPRKAYRNRNLWFTSVVMMLALGTQLAAYAFWDVAYVEAVKRGLGLICSVVFGALLFGEADPWKRLPAVVTMAVGATLVILG